jgi:hypothetical protein
MRFWRRKQRRALILALAAMAIAAPSAQAGKILVDGGAPVPSVTGAGGTASGTAQTQLVRVASHSFSWRDAGIGAATTAAASFLAITGIAASRRRQGEIAV